MNGDFWMLKHEVFINFLRYVQAMVWWDVGGRAAIEEKANGIRALRQGKSGVIGEILCENKVTISQRNTKLCTYILVDTLW